MKSSQNRPHDDPDVGPGHRRLGPARRTRWRAGTAGDADAARPAPRRRAEEGSRRRHRDDEGRDAADGRPGLQLRRARASRSSRRRSTSTGILEKNGFKIERGVAGIPTAWVATWGSGKPVIALGSDIDDIPQASQKPGVALPRSDHRRRAGSRRRAQLRRAAEHHGRARGEEDHGAREAAGHAEALARRRRGAASARKAYFVRAGVFKDVDVVLFAHVGNNLGVGVGRRRRHRPGVGRVHVQGRERARGRRAVARPLGARRRRADGHRLELPPRAPALQQRSHYVITNGGDQPNVVPPNASVWYYFRETDYDAHQGAVGDRRHDGQGARR